MTTARRTQQESASQVVDPLERRLTQALESVPQVTIADDFATRVMRRVPARPNMSFQLPFRASIGYVRLYRLERCHPATFRDPGLDQ